MPNKIKRYAVTGITQPLVDGQSRNVTLVAIVTVQDTVETKFGKGVTKVGKKTITTLIEEDVVTGTTTTLAFGLAVLSPTDIKLQAQINQDYQDALKAIGSAPTEEETNAAKKKVAELATKLNLVSPARGEEIAYGKAAKHKSALAVITTDAQFFTTNMIKLIINDKLKHICSDPNRFIRIAGPKKAAASNVLPIQQNVLVTA